jgi:nondiscriminating aspartyl-tRNA synthetase
MVVAPRVGLLALVLQRTGAFFVVKAVERQEQEKEGRHEMDTRIRTTEVTGHIGERVTVAGWLHILRRLGGINFMVLRDGWGTVQVTVEDEADLSPILEDELGAETVLRVEGTVTANPQAPDGIELTDPAIAVITPVRETPPLTLNKRALRAGLVTVLDHAVIANRHPKRRAIFRLGATAMTGFRETLQERGFTEIQTPKLVASATESGANVFQLDYFGAPAYLAQSPQFYKQIMVGVFERVFEVGPVFRAEPHDTTRHTNEYVSLDVEFGFIEDHFTVMALLREVLAGIWETLAERAAKELALLDIALPPVPETIPHIRFADAQALLETQYGQSCRGEPDLAPGHERLLGQWAQVAHDSDFLFVTGYPMAKRPFYTHPDPENPNYSNSFDLLFRGTELVTGGQRLHRHADYIDALERARLPLLPFESYLEAFRYGMPPHGGFAIGLERLLMQLTGADNLRLTTLFPRDLSRLSP